MQTSKQFREKKEKLGHYIGQRVTEIMDSHDIMVKDLTGVIQPLNGISQSTVAGLMASIRKGWINHYISKTADPERGLRLLSNVFYALSVEEADEMIARVRELYPQFEYPPEKRTEVLVEETDMTLEDMMGKLTLEDREWFSRMASRVLENYERSELV